MLYFRLWNGKNSSTESRNCLKIAWLKLQNLSNLWRSASAMEVERLFIRHSAIMQLNTRGRLLISILHLKTLLRIICFNKTLYNEAGRSLLGRSPTSFRFRTARPTSGSCDLARRF